MFDEDPRDAYENYPCIAAYSGQECKGEVTYFEGEWICNKCEKNYSVKERKE